MNATSDAAMAIAHALRRDGEYVVVTDSLPAQRLVDVLWAAHRAGRMVGQKVDVEVSSSSMARTSQVTVKVTSQRSSMRVR